MSKPKSKLQEYIEAIVLAILIALFMVILKVRGSRMAEAGKV